MTKYIRRFRAPLALCVAFAAAACTVKDNKSDSTLVADSTLNRDLQLANQDTSLQPQLRDVPATPAYCSAWRRRGSARQACSARHAAAAGATCPGWRAAGPD